MRAIALIAALTFPLAVTTATAAGQEPPPVDSLRGPIESLRAQTVAEAETDFARAAGELGIRDAFLAFLAPDAVVFMPRAINGLAHYANAPTEALLAWQPAVAEAAESDDLGYTTGPYTVRASEDGPTTGHGWYFSLWRRDADGVWQVVLDLGTPTPDAPRAPETLQTPAREQVPPSDAESRLTDLLHLDDLIAAAAQQRSARRALTPALGLDARHNYAGAIVEGGVLVARALPDVPVAYHRLGDGISQAGDLAYTYGEYTVGELPSLEQPSGNWVRVWKVGPNGQWSIVQMVTAPIEP